MEENSKSTVESRTEESLRKGLVGVFLTRKRRDGCRVVRDSVMDRITEVS